LSYQKKERIRAKRNGAALHAEAAAGRVMTHIFFHPDYTVGPGFSPGLLTLRLFMPQALAGSAVMAIPPVGNCTPPRRRIWLLPAMCRRRNCSRAGKSLPAPAF
jgi:hypothetical protein